MGKAHCLDYFANDTKTLFAISLAVQGNLKTSGTSLNHFGRHLDLRDAR